MILIDLSSILHRMVFTSTKTPGLPKVDGKLVTSEYINYTLYLIINEIIEVQLKHQRYGEIVLCFDDHRKTYWRRDFFNPYKQSRRTLSAKDETEINYKEVYEYTNNLFHQFRNNLPWKCIYVNKAEADDVILVLSKEFYEQSVLIYSPDKDFLQSQRLPNIVQYSALTKKWLVPENKHNNMMHWINEHVMLGDMADGVPKVTDSTEFSDSFKEYLTNLNKPTEVHLFNTLPLQEKEGLILNFECKTYNRKGQETGLDIFNNRAFGAKEVEKIFTGQWRKDRGQKALKQQIEDLKNEYKINPGLKKQNTQKIKELKEQIENIKIPDLTEEEHLDYFLDSHPMYREHYNRNYILVMEEGIPSHIRASIIMEYRTADTSFNEKEFEEYIDSIGLHQVKSLLPKVFIGEKLDITNHGWDL